MKKTFIIFILCFSIIASLFAVTQTMANGAFLRGDANGDGRVSPADASYILQCIVGLKQFNSKWFKNADVDNDNELTANDAVLILRHIVKLIDLSDPILDVTPSPTQKPTHTPSFDPVPTRSPNPTQSPTPTHYVWTCKYCGAIFGSSDDDYERWYQHVWYNPGCYAYGYAVTPTPAPTPTPSHPVGNGHWEEVWVVDVPRQGHTVWHCNNCGYESAVWYGDFWEHMSVHALAEENTSYYSYSVTDVEEQGHWEWIWVSEP